MLRNLQKNKNLTFDFKIDAHCVVGPEHICENLVSAEYVFGNGRIKENYRELLRRPGNKKKLRGLEV